MGKAPSEGMALWRLLLLLPSLVSAQELNLRSVVRRNYDMAKVGLGTGYLPPPPAVSAL